MESTIEDKEYNMSDELKKAIWHLVQAGNILDDSGFNDAANTIFYFANTTLDLVSSTAKLDDSKLSDDEFENILSEIENS